MLVFSDPGCSPCNALIPEVAAWQRESQEELTVAIVSRGTLELNAARAHKHGLTDVLVQRDREISDSFDAIGTPSAVLIAVDGTIQSPVAAGADAIRALVARAVRPGLNVVQAAAVLIDAEVPGNRWPACGTAVAEA